jgi:periplasmic divalent cation tolerance protein
MTDAKYFIAFSTTDSKDEAEKIAKALVGEGLAACVNIISGVRSIYRWNGKICDEGELLLVMKLTGEKREGLKSRLAELHHYDVPELVFLPIADGLPKYLSWLTSA